MATKTIYVRDDKLWNRARKLAADEGVSGVIHDLLADWVRRKEAEMETEQMTGVELYVGGSSHEAEHEGDVAERIAFTGRLVADSSGWSVGQLPRLQVYQNDRGKLIVYRTFEDTPSFEESGATYRLYRDYEALTADPVALDTMWIEGTPELDEDADHTTELQREIVKGLRKRVVVRVD